MLTMHGQTRRTQRITLVCVFLILLTMCAQAGHNCSALVLDSSSNPHLTASVTANSPCLLCMLAHSATLAVVVLLLSVVPVTRPRVRVVDFFPPISWTGFDLSVRPPPSLI